MLITKDGPVDAFILFNEKEDDVVPLVDQLESREVATYFWRRDVPVGAKWSDLEQERLAAARCVVIFLGRSGWAPNHSKLAEQARSMGKRILPVLIGDPPEEAYDRVGGLFRDVRYMDLREPTEALLTDLANTILEQASEPPMSQASQKDQSTSQFDRLIDLLVDGNDDQRADTLDAIRAIGATRSAGLALRLRSEIVERFSPESEQDYAPAIRDPKKVSSARSWMLSALIWIDAESSSSRELIQRHLDPQYETDRNVRFWVLAGLGQTRASYLGDATSRSRRDPARELQFLSEALTNPADESTIERFRSAMRGGDFDSAWPVFRVLRIVPIPTLAKDVLYLLEGGASGEAWHYDAFHALSLPEMATAAASLATNTETFATLTQLAVQALRGSNFNTAIAFAQFLNALDRTTVDRALSALRSDRIYGDAAARLSQALERLRTRAGTSELSMAGYANDTIDPSADRLDISRDVRTLTAVMLADEVKPPLAIGLFGDWGSGKSFFMKSMQEAVVDLANRTRGANKTNFCTEPVQIEFNAWHYADTNLWASLVDTILEQLSAKVQPQPTAEEQQAALLAELGSTKGIVTQAENEKKEVEKLIKDKQANLEKLRVKREEKEIKLRDLETEDFRQLLAGEDKEGVEQALTELGVPAAVSNVKELAQVVAETNSVRGQLVASVHAMLNQKSSLVFWSLLLVALFGIPIATWALNKAMETEVVNAAAAVAAEIGALITATVAAMRKGLATVRTHLATVEKARKNIEEQLEQKRLKPTVEETELRADIAGLASQEQEAASRLSAASARVVELEEKIKVLNEGRSLARFLTERRQSQDYQKHLGLISTIRKDFQSLVDRLEAAAKSEAKHRVDRIILYIDDLDRCPPDKVLEVLQAVHLLLAFPLFVVVVGVDPRWLRHSLARNYSALQSDLGDDNDRQNGEDGRAEDDWDSRATPQNYLEKIFQVPFSLHRMTETGFGDLVESLLTPSIAGSEAADSTKAISAGQSTPGSDTTTPGLAPADAATIQSSAGGATPPVPSQGTATQTAAAPVPPEKSSAPPPKFVISDDALIIQKWEARFARRLYPLIPTPRAAKRLTNVYRILKACVLRHELKAFEGTDAVAGEFQLPMLLLAMIIKSPAHCAQVFPYLVRRAHAKVDVLDLLRDLEQLETEIDGNKESIRELAVAVRPIVSDPLFTADNSAFLKWIPQVSRYSFEIGGVLRPVTEEKSSSKPAKRPSRRRSQAAANGRAKKT